MPAKKKPRVQVAWRSALIPLSLVFMFLLWRVFHAPVWALALFSLWVPLYYIVYPMVLRKKWEEFEKSFSYLFQKGDYKLLLEHYTSQWFLRRFGPRSEMLAKLGLVYSALDRYREAEQAFERAVKTARPAQKDRLLFNLANVKYELNKLKEAAAIYRSLKPGSPYRHASQTQLALIEVHQGAGGDESVSILERELERTSGPGAQRLREALELAQK